MYTSSVLDLVLAGRVQFIPRAEREGSNDYQLTRRDETLDLTVLNDDDVAHFDGEESALKAIWTQIKQPR